MFQYVDVALLRAATLPGVLTLPPWPDLTDQSDDAVAQWRRWLAQVWAQEPIAAAVEVASPMLARRLREVCDGRHHEPRQVRRMVVSLTRYLLRMTGRATPFGLFAGVAPVRLGAEPSVSWGNDHRPVARADAAWLADVVTRLESCPELLARLPVVHNNLCHTRDGRLVLTCQRLADPESGPTAPAEVSVRHTRAVELVVRAAQSPVPSDELAAKLAVDFPETPQAVIDAMLADLVARRILVTSLRPPMTVVDALGHVVKQLAAAGADAIPPVAAQTQLLREIHDGLSRHNQCAAREQRRAIRASVAEQMSTMSSTVEKRVAVDLRLDCALVLPAQVAREAESAAAALVRLTPFPAGTPSWRDCHARFLDRYGIGSLVPLMELVNADTGLGLPAGYRGSLLEPPPTGLSIRDARLLALAQQAALDGSLEVALDDRAIADLAADDTSGAQPPPHTELCFHIESSTREGVGRGDFTLVLVGASRGAGTLVGRFLDLLDPADQARMRKVYAGLPTVDVDSVAVQVSSPPLHPRTENVARAPSVLPQVVRLGEHGSPDPDRGLVPLNDLAVGADAYRMYLMSLSQRRPVEPAVLNAVELRGHTHPLARFLSEISRSRSAVLIPFVWEAASALPFLPRIRYGRTVLAPARWHLAAAELPRRSAAWPQWTDGLSGWRQRHRLPDAVFLGDNDQRIRLDLTEPLHRAMLRSQLDRSGHATLTEAPAGGAYGWFDGRTHEIVVTLASTTTPVTRRTARRVSGLRTVQRDHGHLPGCSPWLYAKIYGHPDRQASVLCAHLPNLLSRWDTPPQWWFVRYRDPQPHVRLRLRLGHAQAYGRAALCVGAWVAELRGLGLASHMQLDTYHPETGRYGTGEALAAAETVFAADSAVALAQMALTASPSGPHPFALAAASLVDVAIAFLGEVREGMRFLVGRVRPDAGAPAPRTIHSEAMHLADPREDWAALRAVPGGSALLGAWSSRSAALAAYRARLDAAGDPDPESVLAALLHLHLVRTLGIDKTAERVCHRLARAAALAWFARTDRAKP